MILGVSIVGLAGMVLLSGWIGYPMLLRVLGGRPSSPIRPSTNDTIEVSVVIATREEPSLLRARVADLLRTTWPADRLCIVVGVDPLAAHTVADYQLAVEGESRVRCVIGDDPGGKAATLNAACREVTSEIVVFADSMQSFSPEAIPALVSELSTQEVGGVTGRLEAAGDDGLLAAFWKYEMHLRRLESRVGRVVNVTGAIHAMRRIYWEPLPPGLISDDLLIPLRLGRRGLQVTMAEGASARDPRTFTREAQFTRKVRTLTGILQVCAWEPWVLLPWKHRMWTGFVCHKLIRVLTPLLCLIMCAGLVALLAPTARTFVLVLAAAVLLCTFVVALRREDGPAAEAIWALRLLLAPLLACRNAVTGNWAVWSSVPASRTDR